MIDSLSQLAGLSERLEEEESGLQAEVRRAESQHDRTLETLGQKLDESMAQFEALDLSLNHTNGGNGHDNRNGRSDLGGNIAVQIGEKLEELDRKRSRALDANFLIQCWSELCETGQLNSLEDIKRGGGAESKVRCANIARQLMRISQRLDPVSWSQVNGSKRNGVTNGVAGAKSHNTREILEKFSEVLEQDLLEQFNRSYRAQNFPDMMQCAKVLHDFNGGSSVIATFVNQHDFFINRNQLMSDEVSGDEDAWELLADPDKESSGIEQSLQSLVDEVRVVMQEESFIIKQAFPFAETVLIRFIQRVFQQSIQQRLEMVLEKADSVSSLAFLRTLHAARTYIGTLIDDLKTHGLIENPEPCSAQISQTLDQQLDELFVPYLVGNAYIDRERKNLEELYSSLLFKYTIFHSRRKKAPTGFMASLAQQGSQMLTSAKETYLESLDSSELTSTQKTMMLRVAGVKDNSDNKNEIEVTEEDGVLSVKTAQRMMKWLAESVRRTLELGLPSDTAKDVNSLLNLVLSSMGQVYVETALDAALDMSTSQESSKVEPDMSYFSSLRPATTIANIMSHFINTVMIRLAEGNATVRRSMEAQIKMGMESIEKKTNSVVKSSVDVIINWVSRCLTTQKKTDFRPKDNELESMAETTPCQTICNFLKRFHILAKQAIDGHNLEMFSTELALNVHRLLFEHFKKFSVNATGGLIVTKDINQYVSSLKEWPLSKDAVSVIDLLPEIGYLFMIGPEALREKSRNLTTGPAGAAAGKKLSKADFKAFVLKREDANSVGVQSVVNGL